MMNIGIAGAGNIVPHFLEAQHSIAELQVKAICASQRSRERMKRLAEDYSVSSIYYDYKAMLADHCLDVIYIGGISLCRPLYHRGTAPGGRGLTPAFGCSLISHCENNKSLRQSRRLLF